MRLVVVSNWDVSLHDVLGETGLGAAARRRRDLGRGRRRQAGPRDLRARRWRSRRRAGEALHVGDSVEHDVAGALRGRHRAAARRARRRGAGRAVPAACARSPTLRPLLDGARGVRIARRMSSAPVLRSSLPPPERSPSGRCAGATARARAGRPWTARRSRCSSAFALRDRRRDRRRHRRRRSRRRASTTRRRQ